MHISVPLFFFLILPISLGLPILFNYQKTTLEGIGGHVYETACATKNPKVPDLKN